MKLMKFVVPIICCLLLIAVLMLALLSCETASQRGGIEILMLMPRTLGANNFLVRDVFEEYGWRVTKTAVGDATMPCAFWGRYARGRDLRL